MNTMNMSAFEEWFVDCVLEGVDNKNCPDDYVWDLRGQIEEDGEWMEMYHMGLNIKEAVP